MSNDLLLSFLQLSMGGGIMLAAGARPMTSLFAIAAIVNLGGPAFAERHAALNTLFGSEVALWALVFLACLEIVADVPPVFDVLLGFVTIPVRVFSGAIAAAATWGSVIPNEWWVPLELRALDQCLVAIGFALALWVALVRLAVRAALQGVGPIASAIETAVVVAIVLLPVTIPLLILAWRTERVRRVRHEVRRRWQRGLPGLREDILTSRPAGFVSRLGLQALDFLARIGRRFG